MPIAEQKTVWILGAGFSRSLGGPLLADLFGQEYRSDLAPVLPDALVDEVLGAQALFNWGREEGTWHDAEEFLSFVDAAYGAPPDAMKEAKVKALIGRARCPWEPGKRGAAGRPVFELLRDPPAAVRRALAFECSRFLSDPPVSDEIWDPYRAWAKSLVPHLDTVITFNYDMVLESLENRFHIRMPPQCQFYDNSPVPVFKLHGSVNWIITDRNEIQTQDLKKSLKDRANIALAAPGRTKGALAGGLFDPLWVQAVGRIKQAHAVVIVGYGFPKTDAGARMRLLDALSHRDQFPWPRQIHIVLGPDTGLPTNRRVVELLRHRTGGEVRVDGEQRPTVITTAYTTIRQHCLWAEDFIADYSARTNAW